MAPLIVDDEKIAAGAPWMSPFNIKELILHKKYSMESKNSEVGRNSNINI